MAWVGAMRRAKKKLPCSTCGRIVRRTFAIKIVECVPCRRARCRRYYEAHREKRLAEVKRWTEAHKPVVLARHAEWRRANPKKMLQYKRRYRANLKNTDALIGAVVACDCGLSHSLDGRLSILRRLDAAPSEILESYPCLWAGEAGERRLYRDLAALKSSSEKQPTRAA